MKKHGVIFVFCLFSALTYSFRAWADIEAIQAVITYLGDVVEDGKAKIEDLKSLYESGQQLASQAKKYVDDGKAMVQKGKQTYNSIKEKAEAIQGKATALAEAVKNGDMSTITSGLSNMEFSNLKNAFDGSHADDEMADAVLDTLVRKKGENSIANEEVLKKAINKQTGLAIANVYAKSMILRHDLLKEEDEFHNPQSVDEAMDLCQKKQLQMMERQNRIMDLQGSTAKFHHTRAVGDIKGDYEGDKQDE